MLVLTCSADVGDSLTAALPSLAIHRRFIDRGEILTTALPSLAKDVGASIRGKPSGILGEDLQDDENDGRSKKRHRSVNMKKMVRTPARLDFCKSTWPFQDKKTHKNVHMCVKCKAGAPLPLAIALNGKRAIWICNANRFKKKEECEKRMSWLGTSLSATGESTKQTCANLRRLVRQNNKATEMLQEHNKHLKLGRETKSAEVYQQTSEVKTRVNIETSRMSQTTMLAATNIRVERSILASSFNNRRTHVFVVDSHSIRSCRTVQGQPLLCLDIKRSKCIWSKVVGNFNQFPQGKGLPKGFKPDHRKRFQNQPCTAKETIRLATARKL